MRPQQQNRRMRGRGNNRKGPNPLTRSYESNGPDVKIRGTAQQIAEKYTTLARDAQSSGDRVIAENYLQHAEHYNRLIAAAQAQVQPQQNMRESRDDDSDDLDEREEQEAFGFPNFNNKPAAPAVNDGSGPQPVIDGMPAEVALNREAGGSNGNGRSNGRNRGGNGAHPGANGQAAAGERAAADKPEKAQEAEPAAAKAAPESVAEEAPTPKPKRIRKPRAKKADEAAQQAEAAGPTEEAAAQN
ncbi:DUF4167 domain-containing protein [Chelativorans sp. AA-79]|uniref:DUF4167 domain-containing protein n=1 Tax=Chelativorans sp. AA-79 TaxID=3028735 RepID=UPI0023FA3232|nr:DUF4167 domain-containing protein [Chelativorans sp. AA-79]WEX09004.1 DUF4167 domain-containing protein [Chelativorans sp. AA-79]